MIHIIKISARHDEDVLRKEFRKAAMTGGGVLRLDQQMSRDDGECLLRYWVPLINQRNLAYDVVRQFALSQSYNDFLLHLLGEHGLQDLQEGLFAESASMNHA